MEGKLSGNLRALGYLLPSPAPSPRTHVIQPRRCCTHSESLSSLVSLSLSLSPCLPANAAFTSGSLHASRTFARLHTCTETIVGNFRVCLNTLPFRVGEDTYEMYLRHSYRYTRGYIFCIFQMHIYRYH